jgi:hypothetical protein
MIWSVNFGLNQGSPKLHFFTPRDVKPVSLICRFRAVVRLLDFTADRHNTLQKNTLQCFVELSF